MVEKGGDEVGGGWGGKILVGREGRRGESEGERWGVGGRKVWGRWGGGQ